ncbi:TrmH family RNA methyltransferase [Amycolatopsis jiangsuensis]|uniref:TrmH family RNA methyltransferase n=1 Tax=Amycolatopsis jiangsuensis TaxID=1181879 RepID=A0A840IY39_9PSEU|nr:RNA methyltransferase [Amycolatopsis jiangsuensis]MBB4685784.1 TrmH family RNA methyltransferase [Amycolatopsis jiangsuensis]
MTGLITSAANPLAKRVRQLADRKHRRAEEAFVVEGLQPVWCAVEAGWDIETLIVAPDLLAGAPARRMVEERERAGVAVARVSADLFARLVDRDGPGGLAAIVRTRPGGLSTLDAPSGAIFVALHRIANPGNLGTIIRTVDAVGGAGVILIGDTVDAYSPAAVKASMGSLFAVDVVHTPDAGAFFGWAAERGVTVLATSGTADGDHWRAGYEPPLAVLLGSEREGLPEDLLAAASRRLRIPMVGTVDSLNIGVAASIVLYEARRNNPITGS